MQYTSAEANKLLRKLKEEELFIRRHEIKSSSFNAALGEDVESVRPDYDFARTAAALEDVQRKMRAVKHAINVFNTTKMIGGMTIDEVLIRLPQLRSRKEQLAEMAMVQPKERVRAYGSGTSTVIDYSYANYDVAEAKAEFERVTEEISSLQLELDKVNATEMMEIPL